MNINHVVCVRSNWFAEIKTGTIIGEHQPMRCRLRISSAYYLLQAVKLKNSKGTLLFWQENTTKNIIYIPCRIDALHVRLSRSLSLALALFSCEKKAKWRRVVRFTLELTVCQIQVRCASIQMIWKIDRLTESETLKRSVREYFFFAALNSGCLWQHSTTSCACILSS